MDLNEKNYRGSMKVDYNTILIIAKSVDILDMIADTFSGSDKEYVLISNIKEGLNYMEAHQPMYIIAEESIEFPAAEPIAVRFSELLMFNSSVIYMITPNYMSKFERVKFNSLGFNMIVEHIDFSKIFQVILSQEQKLRA
jgi:hypothetical protein